MLVEKRRQRKKTLDYGRKETDNKEIIVANAIYG
jgi:hypothetical protein